MYRLPHSIAIRSARTTIAVRQRQGRKSAMTAWTLLIVAALTAASAFFVGHAARPRPAAMPAARPSIRFPPITGLTLAAAALAAALFAAALAAIAMGSRFASPCPPPRRLPAPRRLPRSIRRIARRASAPATCFERFVLAGARRLFGGRRSDHHRHRLLGPVRNRWSSSAKCRPFEFLFGTQWSPTADPPSFGFIPLLVGTLAHHRHRHPGGGSARPFVGDLHGGICESPACAAF